MNRKILFPFSNRPTFQFPVPTRKDIDFHKTVIKKRAITSSHITWKIIPWNGKATIVWNISIDHHDKSGKTCQIYEANFHIYWNANIRRLSTYRLLSIDCKYWFSQDAVTGHNHHVYTKLACISRSKTLETWCVGLYFERVNKPNG